jgi:hypothetical protein
MTEAEPNPNLGVLNFLNFRLQTRLVFELA